MMQPLDSSFLLISAVAGFEMRRLDRNMKYDVRNTHANLMGHCERQTRRLTLQSSSMLLFDKPSLKAL